MKAKFYCFLLLNLFACSVTNNNPSIIDHQSTTNQEQDSDINYFVYYAGILIDNQCITSDKEGRLKTIYSKDDYGYFQDLPEYIQLNCLFLPHLFDRDRFLNGIKQFGAEIDKFNGSNSKIAIIRIDLEKKIKSAIWDKENMIKEQKRKSKPDKQKKAK